MDSKALDRWPDDEVQALLTLYAEYDIQQQVEMEKLKKLK